MGPNMTESNAVSDMTIINLLQYLAASTAALLNSALRGSQPCLIVVPGGRRHFQSRLRSKF